jgi:hypothetical protein
MQRPDEIQEQEKTPGVTVYPVEYPPPFTAEFKEKVTTTTTPTVTITDIEAIRGLLIVLGVRYRKDDSKIGLSEEQGDALSELFHVMSNTFGSRIRGWLDASGDPTS